MEGFLVIGANFLLLAAVGLLPAACLWLIFRKKSTYRKGWRALLVTLAAASGLITGMLFMTWLNASIGYGFYQESYGSTPAGLEIKADYSSLMVWENFLRRITPPPHTNDCLLGNVLVCQQIDMHNQWRSEAHDWSAYRTNLLLAAISVLSGGLLMSILLRKSE